MTSYVLPSEVECERVITSVSIERSSAEHQRIPAEAVCWCRGESIIRDWNVERMSFMRGIVENTIRNMSPDERMDALKAVTSQVIGSMSEQERVDTLVEVLGQLARSVPEERLADALRRIKSS